MGRYFSTLTVDRPERATVWQQHLATQCSVFDIQPATVDFDASLEQRSIGALTCSRIQQSALRATRSMRQIHNGPVAKYLLIMQIAGTSNMAQAERACQMQRGDITLIDPMQPCEFRFEETSTQISVHIPADRLSHKSELSAFLAMRLPTSTSRLVGPLIRSSFDLAGLRGTLQIAVADAIIGLIEEGLFPESSETHDLRSDKLRVVQRYMLDHLGDDMTPASIACANGLSERALHRLFANHGLSVTNWMKKSRLHNCANDLLDPTLSSETLTSVAFRWGFNNMSHFSREFRSVFGTSPSDYRKSRTSAARF